MHMNVKINNFFPVNSNVYSKKFRLSLIFNRFYNFIQEYLTRFLYPLDGRNIAGYKIVRLLTFINFSSSIKTRQLLTVRKAALCCYVYTSLFFHCFQLSQQTIETEKVNKVVLSKVELLAHVH